MAEEQRRPALVRAWRWLWEPSQRKLHVGACPRCGSTVVMPAGQSERVFDRLKLPEPPDDGQLLAACPDHGWEPFNERSRRLRNRR